MEEESERQAWDRPWIGHQPRVELVSDQYDSGRLIPGNFGRHSIMPVPGRRSFRTSSKQSPRHLNVPLCRRFMQRCVTIAIGKGTACARSQEQAANVCVPSESSAVKRGRTALGGRIHTRALLKQ